MAADAPKRWIKLTGPQMVFNAPNITNKFMMTNTKTVPWDWSADRIMASVFKQARHLIFNCHGFPSRPNFPAAHLSLGTVLHAGNVGAFDALASIYSLRVIWLSACAISSSQEGGEFCAAMARNSGCYVVSSIFSVYDRPGRAYHIEDYYYAMPVYYDWRGQTMSPAEFFALGKDYGFKRV